jgi:glycosyltransferase involved in cell wall biosynthesis
MRIAQVSPLFESVPPKYYGGTERVIHCLTEEFVKGGHEVTLFASGDSRTSARLKQPCGQALRLDEACLDKLAPHVLMLETVSQLAKEFDVIHFHLEYMHLPLTRKLPVSTLTTMHGRTDMSYLMPIFDEFREAALVSISNAQRRPLPWLNWQDTIHHGLPVNSFRFCEKPQNYALFLGRMSPEKGVHRAIEIARQAGIHLKIAAKIDPRDREYYRDVIKPLLREPGVEYIGEVGDGYKGELIGGALALIHPIDFPEPFSVVLIEALACGTPIVAFRQGSIPEIIEPGITGFVCDDIAQAVDSLRKVPALKRRDCRDSFERRFTSIRMAYDYLRSYERLMMGGHFADNWCPGQLNMVSTDNPNAAA